MSLLEKIQAKNQENAGVQNIATPVEEIEQPKPQKKDLLSSFRESGRSEQPQKVKDKQISKHQELKNRLYKQILNDLKDDDIESIVPKLDAMTVEIMKEDESFRGKIDRKKVVDELINDLTGFGPINPLLLDPDVSEVMVNGPHQVYVEKMGKVELTHVRFRDDEHVMSVIDKIVAPIGRRIDESSPMVDARLPDGSRVNAIIPPLALNGPTITIRKFATDPFKVEDLVNFGTVSRQMATFLDACVKAKLNMFVSGGTGSGKTTTLNVLSAFIPNHERIITIEDAAEQIGRAHV